jgi:acyl carrier protein
MPRLGSAKIDKLTLAKQAADLVPSTAAVALQGQDLRVAEIWARTINTGLPDYETDFFDAGGDSLSATTFIVELEKEFQTEISANILFDYPTFGAVSCALNQDPTRNQHDSPP